MKPAAQGDLATIRATMIFFQSLGHSNQIFIHTEKQQYYAGELVRGQVMLAVASAINVDSINIKLSGYEQAEFDYQVSRNVPAPTKENPHATRLVTETRHARQSNTFFKRKYVLYAVRSTLVGGNFCFPFEFTLDQGLPGTFSLSNSRSSGTHATVHYEVRAEVQVPGLFESDLKHYQELLICQPLKQQLMSSDTYKEARVTFLCCIPKGTVSLAATIDKNAYAPGEPVMLTLIVDNSQSQVHLESFSFRLERNITLRADSQTHYDNAVIVKTKCPGVPRGERAERRMAVQLPVRTEPSTDAQLVKCNYRLIVELAVPWSPNVKVSQAVQVYAAPLPTYSAALTLPAGWAPQVMPSVNLSAMQYQTY